MKNENLDMQALHHKLDVVLVQILHYNCLETDYSFCEDSPPSRTPPSTQMRVSSSDPFTPPLFFFAPPPLMGGEREMSRKRYGDRHPPVSLPVCGSLQLFSRGCAWGLLLLVGNRKCILSVKFATIIPTKFSFISKHFPLVLNLLVGRQEGIWPMKSNAAYHQRFSSVVSGRQN